MNRTVRHVRRQILRGLLAVIPLALTYFVLRLIYVVVDQRVARLIERWCGFRIPGLGLLLVLVLLYLAGLLASHWLGRQAFERIGIEQACGVGHHGARRGARGAVTGPKRARAPGCPQRSVSAGGDGAVPAASR